MKIITGFLIKTAVNIQTILVDAAKECEALRISLQAEYMYMYSPEITKEMKAKEKQVRSVEFLRQTCLNIFDMLNNIDDFQFKLEACSVYHGVSFHELRMFVGRPVKEVAADVKTALNEGWVQVPEKLQPLIDQKESERRWMERLEKDLAKLEGKETPVQYQPAPEIKYTKTPVIGVENLRLMAERELNGTR